MIFTAFLEMLSLSLIPLFIAAIVDLEGLILYLPNFEIFLLGYSQKEIIFYGAFFLLIIFLLKNIILAIQYYNENNLILNLNKSFAVKLFKNYLNSNYLFYISKNTGYFIRNLTSEVSNSVNLAYGFLILLREGLVTIVIISILIARSPSIAILFFFILVIATFLFFKIFKSKIKKTSAFAQELRSSQMQLINQSFGLFKTVKIFDIENILSKKFDLLTYKKEKSEFYLKFIKLMPKLLFELIAITSLLLICTFLIIFYSGENILIILSTIAVAVVRLVPAFNSITSALTGINELMISFKVIHPELNKDQNIKLLSQEVIKDTFEKKEKDIFQKITLKDINFKYDTQKEYFIKNLNLEILKGDSIAIVGKSGSGKTTLVDLIIGLLNLNSGDYLLNNKKINNPISYWKSKVGYVAQEVYLTDDTIKANVAFSEQNIDENIDKKVNDALKSSAMEDFTKKLPDKELSKVGERGGALSGGQRQRLAFARAIYNNPEIIVMDEATSALDQDTEDEILYNLENLKKNKTLIVIAHKLKTILSMDKIILMENGSIKFFGTKNEYLLKYNIEIN
jgi:ATP-binding cassette, subfamily B, bacterial PglK